MQQAHICDFAICRAAAWWDAMKDMAARLEMLRRDAAECELIRDSANQRKRELFERLAAHLKMLAGEVERAIITNYPPDAFLGRKTQEPFPKEEAE